MGKYITTHALARAYNILSNVKTKAHFTIAAAVYSIYIRAVKKRIFRFNATVIYIYNRRSRNYRS